MGKKDAIEQESGIIVVVDDHRGRSAVRAFLAALAEPELRKEIAALGMTFPEQDSP